MFVTMREFQLGAQTQPIQYESLAASSLKDAMLESNVWKQTHSLLSLLG